jgi:hypothetical protein
MILKAAEAIEVKAILLPDNFDHALIGYTIHEGSRTAVGVYDYDKAACRTSHASECSVDIDLEDALLDAIRAIEGDVKPVIIHTGE